MKKNKSIARWWIWLLLPVLLLAYSCEDDEAEPEDAEWVQWKELFSGYAEGSNVAPLFRAHPMNFDSLSILLYENTPNELDPENKRYYLRLEMYGDDKKIIITGGQYPARGARLSHHEIAEVDSITKFQSAPQDSYIGDVANTIEGIYKIAYEPGPTSLKIEFVYNKHNWPSPPTAEDGFGSTGDGGYGNNNVHTFISNTSDRGDD